MTRDEMAVLLDRFLAGMRAHDVDAMMAVLIDKCTYESPAGGHLKGKPAIEAFYRAWFDAFPDLQLQQKRRLQDGHRAVVVSTFTATHRGELFGMPGTGKRVTFDVLTAVRFEGTGIAGLRFFYDFAAALMKTGALKVKPV